MLQNFEGLLLNTLKFPFTKECSFTNAWAILSLYHEIIPLMCKCRLGVTLGKLIFLSLSFLISKFGKTTAFALEGCCEDSVN